MERETIKVSDLANGLSNCIDDWYSINAIECNQIYFDGEKGSATYQVVVQRISDNKFFKFQYIE